MAVGAIGGTRGLGSEVGGVLNGLLGGDLTMGTPTGGVTTPTGAGAGVGQTGDLPVHLTFLSGSGSNGRIIGASFHFVVTAGFSAGSCLGVS